MRIAFFECTSNDREYLEKRMPGYDLFFFEEPLTEKNVNLAKDCEALSVFIYSSVNQAVIDTLPKLQSITTRSTGFDHIDVAYCEKKGISVQNVPHYGENTVAEHTFALILALSRNVHRSYARGKENNFSIQGLVGFDLKGKTLGVIGTGHIGLHVIRIAKGFGMHVLAYDMHQNTFLSEVLHFSYAPLETILSQADILTLHVPYNKYTHHLINKETLTKIKPGALLINTARGGVVEKEALIEGLNTGIIGGAGLDVVEGEEQIIEETQCLHTSCSHSPEEIASLKDLFNRENVVFTPHIGFYSKEAVERILDTTISNIQHFVEKNPENQVKL